MPRKVIPYNPKLKELARDLRNNSPPGEIRLWQELKAKQFLGYDFHRQKPLLSYIIDFYCAELNLVIEIDGRYHEEITDKDLKRTEELEQHQLTVVRFTEQEVKTDMFNVLRTLEIYVDAFNKKINDLKKDTPLTPLERGSLKQTFLNNRKGQR